MCVWSFAASDVDVTLPVALAIEARLRRLWQDLYGDRLMLLLRFAPTPSHFSLLHLAGRWVVVGGWGGDGCFGVAFFPLFRVGSRILTVEAGRRSSSACAGWRQGSRKLFFPILWRLSLHLLAVKLNDYLDSCNNMKITKKALWTIFTNMIRSFMIEEVRKFFKIVMI